MAAFARCLIQAMQVHGRHTTPWAGSLRFVADGLSCANAVCGALSIWCAWHQSPFASLLLLLAGACFDGLDGAAARRFGGTRFGVLADDVADAISYAIAPGVAVACALSGTEGTVIGVSYIALTIARLVYFTLHKKSAADDPRFFRGVPSTMGGVLALSAVILFPHGHAIVGFIVGVAVVLMVSFDSAYEHVGRELAGLPLPRRVGLLLLTGLVALSAVVAGPGAAASAALCVGLCYGFLPHIARFRELARRTAFSRPAAPGLS